MKRTVLLILSILTIATITFTQIPAAYADPELSSPEPEPIEEDYVGITSITDDLHFSHGDVICAGKVDLSLNYSATITMYLKKDGNTVSSWTYNAALGEFVVLSESYGAVSGSTYQMVLSIKVYNSAGSLVTTIPFNGAMHLCPY